MRRTVGTGLEWRKLNVEKSSASFRCLTVISPRLYLSNITVYGPPTSLELASRMLRLYERGAMHSRSRKRVGITELDPFTRSRPTACLHHRGPSPHCEDKPKPAPNACISSSEPTRLTSPYY